MTTYLEDYLEKAECEVPGTGRSLGASAREFSEKHLDRFTFNQHVAGLLFGHVQSGKTRQMFAIASAAADKEFKLFVLVTTNNVRLYRQTLERAKDALGKFTGGFRVLGELDDETFLSIRSQAMPTLVVLKKDASVLRRWRNHVRSSLLFKDEAVFLLDDEGDASSLNTNVNDEAADPSAINEALDGFRFHAPSSFYLHVTATPQSLLLQSAASAWKPAFAHYIAPGNGYLGGDFFYGEESTCIRETADNEKEVLVQSEEIPEGLRRAILSFLIAGAHTLITTRERKGGSLLIHPGIKIEEHRAAQRKAERYLADIKDDLLSGAKTVAHDLHDAWRDLSATKPALSPFDAVLAYLQRGLPQVNVVVLNSQAQDEARYDSGLNIIAGGNSLGRGVTFPGLHTVYYCRSAKTPQADTCWQHARAFGYDRDPGLCRIFMPNALVKLFRELNESNNALFATLRSNGPDGITILTPDGARPTRTNVLKRNELVLLGGGVNYFPFAPLPVHTDELDRLLDTGADGDRSAAIAHIAQIMRLVEVEKGDSWETHGLLRAVEGLIASGTKTECRLIVRTDRRISRGTGTLLSQTDRELGSLYADKLVLTMYRTQGTVDQGWSGKPLWIPNLRFPEGRCFSLNAGQ